MAEMTKEEYRASAARGLDLRDVVGAWLVCALVASIALAVSGDFHAPPASASVATALMQTTPGNGEMLSTARK
jgi:lipopolysaccharide export LptBFGC system permease protein LptF